MSLLLRAKDTVHEFSNDFMRTHRSGYMDIPFMEWDNLGAVRGLCEVPWTHTGTLEKGDVAYGDTWYINGIELDLLWAPATDASTFFRFLVIYDRQPPQVYFGGGTQTSRLPTMQEIFEESGPIVFSPFDFITPNMLREQYTVLFDSGLRSCIVPQTIDEVVPVPWYGADAFGAAHLRIKCHLEVNINRNLNIGVPYEERIISGAFYLVGVGTGLPLLGVRAEGVCRCWYNFDEHLNE